MDTTKQLNKQYLWAALALLFTMITIFSFAQKREQEPVKVKIVKIVDGDTTTVEKSMGESSVEDFVKQFEDVKGKKMQMMVTVQGDEKDKGKSKNKNRSSSSSSAMTFNFDIDSATAHAMSKCFVFADSARGRKFVWNDSLMKGLPKDFNFNFNFDDEEIMKDFDFDFNIDTKEDGKTVIIKKNGGNTIVINGDEDNISISKSDSEDSKSRTRTKTIVINDDKSKTKKKVIVTTSVVVIDMDDEKRAERRSGEKMTDAFSFYPNPSDGNFTLDLDLNGSDAASVRIVDMNGKEVYTEKITGNGKVSKGINLDGKKGTFIVTIKQGKRTSSKKIIIE